MAFKELDVPIHWPVRRRTGSTTFNMSSVGFVDSATDRAAYVVRIRRAGEIRRIRFGIDDSTLWPDPGYRCSITPVDLTPGLGGEPVIGSDHAFGDYSGAAPNIPGMTTTPDLTSDGTPSGSFYNASVDELLSFTFTIPGYVSGRLAIGAYTLTQGWQPSQGYAWNFQHLGFGWSKLGTESMLSIEYVDGFIDHLGLAKWIDGDLIAVTSPGELGNVVRSNLPVRAFAIWASVDGFQFKIETATKARLYHPNGQLLAEGSTHELMRDTQTSIWVFDAAKKVELVPGLNYRAVIAGNQTLDRLLYEAETDLEAERERDSGALYQTSRPDTSSAFTDATDRAVVLGLLIDAIDPVKTRGTRVIRLRGARNVRNPIRKRLKGERI